MSLVYWLDLTGCAVFAVSGALAAGRKELDLVGVVVLGFVTAIGGGTLRDLLLDRNPIFWLQDQMYIVVIAGAALATVAYSRWRAAPMTALLVADALGLALFAVLGAHIADRAGAAPLASVLLGTMTGCAGGVIRDVLVTETPLIFRPGHLYATCAVAGTAAYLAMLRFGVDATASALAGMAVVAAMRLLSIRRHWQLPVFRLPRDPGGDS
jgi:uncharacterized membrane protein YeiH